MRYNVYTHPSYIHTIKLHGSSKKEGRFYPPQGGGYLGLRDALDLVEDLSLMGPVADFGLDQAALGGPEAEG